MELSPQRPVPVFPLPDLLVFPRTVVPLHVFELRYRAMVRDALENDRLIVMALLKPGWELDYHDSPQYFPLGCLARVQAVEWLPNDCYDLKVEGLSRVRIAPTSREYPYRAARVSVVPQEPLSEDDPLVELEKQALSEAFQSFARELGNPVTLREEMALEALANHICLSLGLEPADKLRLLELDSLLERSRHAREWMARRAARAAPPRQGEGERN